jgi:hypothetical protein
MKRSTVQPIANRIFIDLQDAASRPDGISFCQSAHGGLENQRIALQTIVSRAVIQGHTAPTPLTKRLGPTMIRAIFDHFAWLKGNSIVFTAFVWTIERFPVHFCALVPLFFAYEDTTTFCFRATSSNQLRDSTQHIKI